MEKGVKIIVWTVVAVLAIVAILFAAGVVKLPFQQVIPTPTGNIDCKNYVECSNILKTQGYNAKQIDSILTICDQNGCRVMS